MYTLRDASNNFAKLDNLHEEKFTAYDKNLRDISQRFYLQDSGMVGRATQYDLPAICALRLIQKAFPFGLSRPTLNQLARWMQEAESMASTTRIQEAIERAKNGEDFSFHILMRGDGSFGLSGSESEDETVAQTLKDMEAASPWDARFSIDASRLIREVLGQLEKTE